jgi:hypothetical protein
MTNKALHGIDPLKDLLSDVLSRLENLETKVGIAPPHHASSSASFTTPAPNEANLAGAYSIVCSMSCFVLFCTSVTLTLQPLQRLEKSPPSKLTTVT